VVSRRRKKEISKKRNFFPLLLITILLWLVLTGFVFFISPEGFAAVPLFFILIFITLMFTAAIILANTRRGVIVALCLTIFLILRYFGVGNLLNLLLLLGAAIAFEIYFSKNS